LTQGHRHAIELYHRAGETALLASGPEFLKTISQNAPAIAQVSATAPQITGWKNVAVMNLVIPATPGNRMPPSSLFVTNNENQLGFAKAAMFYRHCPSTL